MFLDSGYRCGKSFASQNGIAVRLTAFGCERATQESLFQGLLGSYRFYNHCVSVRLMTLPLVASWTLTFRERSYLGMEPDSSLVLFAASFNMQKVFFINTATGDVFVRCRSTTLLRACPPSEGGARDGVLRWLEEYASNMEAGMYECRLLRDDEDSKAIVLYPLLGPASSTAITRGVQVDAGAILIPELSSPPQYHFCYSIQFSMISEEEQRRLDAEEKVLSSAQLLTRHWVIEDGRNHVDEVRGEAVVGLYPHVTPGAPPVVYQSCTSMDAIPGSMQGSFSFWEGTIDSPTGPQFDVKCAAFRLDLPEFII